MLAKRSNFDLMFSDLFTGFPFRSRDDWSPVVDVHEDKEKITVEMELPGIDPKNVDVSLDNNVLTIKGKRFHESKDKEYHMVERYHGSFSRSFTVPSSINSSKILADYKNGMLVLMLPKKSEVVPKKIEVQISK